MFKINNKDTRTWHHSGISFVNFEHKTINYCHNEVHLRCCSSPRLLLSFYLYIDRFKYILRRSNEVLYHKILYHKVIVLKSLVFIFLYHWKKSVLSSPLTLFSVLLVFFPNLNCLVISLQLIFLFLTASNILIFSYKSKYQLFSFPSWLFSLRAYLMPEFRSE